MLKNSIYYIKEVLGVNEFLPLSQESELENAAQTPEMTEPTSKQLKTNEPAIIKNQSASKSDSQIVNDNKTNYKCAVIVSQLNFETKELLLKILSAINLEDYLICEVTPEALDPVDIDSMSEKINSLNIEYGLIFHDHGGELSFGLKNKNQWLITQDISHYLGESEKVKDSKKSLWVRLKKWGQHIKLIATH